MGSLPKTCFVPTAASRPRLCLPLPRGWPTGALPRCVLCPLWCDASLVCPRVPHMAGSAHSQLIARDSYFSLQLQLLSWLLWLTSLLGGRLF